MPALGGSYRQPVFGRNFYNAQDQGSTGGAANVSANTSSLQAVFDLAKANSPATVYIPGDTDILYTNRPLYIEGDDIEVVGSNRPILDKIGHNSCLINIGISRAWTSGIGGVEYAAHSALRPLIDGMLDGSVSSRRGVSLGAFVACSFFNSFTFGPAISGSTGTFANVSDYWQQSKYIAIEFAVSGGVLRNTALFGNGPRSDASPFVVWANDSSGIVLTICQQPSGYPILWSERNNRKYSHITMPQIPGNGVKRYCFQFDAGNLRYQAYQSGIQKLSGGIGSTGSEYSGDGMVWTHNSFNRPEKYQFGLGWSNDQVGWTESGMEGDPFTLCGLRISRQPVYLDQGTGIAEARVGGGTINDSSRYFTNGTHVVGYLPLNEGTYLTAPYELNFFHGTATSDNNNSYGLIVVKNGYPKPSRNIILKDLRVNDGAGQRIGCGLMLGLCPDFRGLGLSIYGQFAGVGSANFGSGVRNIVFSQGNMAGIDCAYYGVNQQYRCEDIKLDAIYRNGIFNVSCDATWEEIFANGPGGVNELMYVARGGGLNLWNSHYFRKYTWNNESSNPELVSAIPRRGNIIIDSVSGCDNYIRIIDTNMGQGTQKDFACLLLCGSGSQFPLGRVHTTNLIGYGNTLVTVEDGSLWKGKLETVTTETWDANVFRRMKKGLMNVIFNDDNCQVTAEHNDLSYPPNDLKWIKGGHILNDMNTNNGGVNSWYCRRTGECYSAIPPIWSPIDVINDNLLSDNPISAYATTNIYGQVNIS